MAHIWYTAGMDKDDQPPPHFQPGEEIWPPPPTVISHLVSVESRLRWFRPALWLGIAFNVLACIPVFHLLKFHMGADIGWEAMYGPRYPILYTAEFAFIVGLSFAVWQLCRRLRGRQSIFWEGVGCFLCISPFFVGYGLLLLVLKVKDFDSF